MINPRKIIVLGGAGVFGERIARMLVRDAQTVILAGRTKVRIQTLADELGCGHIVVDRAGDLSPLWAAKPDLVIDAAGPFHAYGDDPYRLARAAIAAKCNYVDLADDADFCTGIGGLDHAAKEAGVFALSGVSSVPALSSAVVAELAQGQDIEAIDMAILPGNRAPRGQAVVDSILHQAGTTFVQYINGKPEQVRSWSDPKWFELQKGMRRLGFVIRIPDHVLFPDFFKAKTVRFHAGLELRLTNWGLFGFAYLRSRLGFGIPRWLTRFARFAASLVQGFGSDEGGMCVDVTVRTDRGIELRTWRLLAQDGQGPFVPGVPARIVARNLRHIPAGARPALAEFTLDDLDSAIADLAITTHSTPKATRGALRAS